MEITEEQLTGLLKLFLEKYSGHFSHVTFDQEEKGLLVHFHQIGETVETEQEHGSSQSNPTNDLLNPLNPLSPISVFNNFNTNSFGFGGGLSGGGGASRDW